MTLAMNWFIPGLLFVAHIAALSGDFYIKEWIIDNATLPHVNRGVFGAYDSNQQQIQFFGGYYDSNIEYTYNVLDGQIEYNQNITTTKLFRDVGQASTMYFNADTSYLFFGNVGDEYSPYNFYIFSLDTNVICLETPYPKPAGFPGQCYTNDDKYIYLLGGFPRGENPTNAMYKLKVTDAQPKWQIGPSFTVERYNAACKCIDDQLFIFGGLTDGFPYSGTSVVEMLENPSSAHRNAKWDILDATGPMIYAVMGAPFAIYPVKDPFTNDNWISSNIFIMNFQPDRDENSNYCFVFNWRTYTSANCSLPTVPVNYSPFVHGYVEDLDEYRVYLFGGNVNASAWTDMIQYAVFDYN